jgi:hypothetical protein
MALRCVVWSLFRVDATMATQRAHEINTQHVGGFQHPMHDDGYSVQRIQPLLIGLYNSRNKTENKSERANIQNAIHGSGSPSYAVFFCFCSFASQSQTLIHLIN